MKACNSDINGDFQEFDYAFVEDKKSYDYLLLVSGCSIKCAEIGKYIIKNKIIDINNNNYKEYKKIIYTVINK